MLWKYVTDFVVYLSKFYWNSIPQRIRHNIRQKQPFIGVLIKTCSENMQQIYRTTPMPKCDLIAFFSRLLLKPGSGPWIRTLKNLDLEKPRPWKTWTLKNLDPENLDPEKPRPLLRIKSLSVKFSKYQSYSSGGVLTIFAIFIEKCQKYPWSSP